MTLKEIINNCIKHNKELGNFLKSIDLDKRSADQITEELKSELPAFGYSVALHSKFCQLLQLLNSKELIEEFDLEQIGELLGSAVEIEEFTLENTIELAHFSWAVLDNEILARQIAGKGIEKAEFALNKFHSLIDAMNIDKQNVR